MSFIKKLELKEKYKYYFKLRFNQKEIIYIFIGLRLEDIKYTKLDDIILLCIENHYFQNCEIPINGALLKLNSYSHIKKVYFDTIYLIFNSYSHKKCVKVV